MNSNLSIHKFISPAIFGMISPFFVGRVSLLEIISVLWFVIGGFKKLPSFFSSSYSRTGLFYVASLFLLISDIVNQTSFDNLLKGVGAYALFPTTVLFLITRFSKIQILALILSYSFVDFIASDMISGGFSQGNFKFGFANIFLYVTLAASLFLSRLSIFVKSISIVPYCTAFVIALVGLWGNLRLLSLVAFLSLVFCLNNRRLPRSFSLYNRSPNIILKISIIFPAVLILFSMSLSKIILWVLPLIPNKFLPSELVGKTITQMSGSLGLLFGGRSEIFSSVIAWFQKPLLGWGSWAADPFDYFNLQGKILMAKLGYSLDFDIISERFEAGFGTHGIIPTHSVLLNLLVWAGILGFIPIYIFICNFIFLGIGSLQSERSYCYPFVFSWIYFLWSFLFSPFGFANRLILELLGSLVIAWFLEVFFKQILKPNIHPYLLKTSLK